MNKLRKVQRTPTGTFFVCLPRSWAEKNGLKKGMQVALDEASDSRLFIDAKFDAEHLPKVAILVPGPFLSREIVGRYLLGFDVVLVEAKERVDFDVRNIVKQTVGSLVGLEIVEESSSQMVLQCLLAPSSFSPETLLLRNFAIVCGMSRDAVGSLVDGDLQLAKNVVARGAESDRQYLLLVRVLHIMSQDSALSQKLGLTPVECLDYRLVASLVEAVGDASGQLAAGTLELNGVKLSEELKSSLVGLEEVCSEACDNALKAFVGKDVALAESVRGLRGKVDAGSMNVEKAARNQNVEVMMQILAAAASLKRVYNLGVDLADLVM